MKKDFSKGINSGNMLAYMQAAAEEPVEDTATKNAPAEPAKRAPGRPRVEGKRISLIVRDEELSYITTMSRVRGQTATAFVNDILAQHMRQNKDLYDQAKTFIAQNIVD